MAEMRKRGGYPNVTAFLNQGGKQKIENVFFEYGPGVVTISYPSVVHICENSVNCLDPSNWNLCLTANSNPCEHAGKCMNTDGAFYCECLKGYAGPRCEMDINECHSDPCQNDATCLDKIGGFTCLCMPGEWAHYGWGLERRGCTVFLLVEL